MAPMTSTNPAELLTRCETFEPMTDEVSGVNDMLLFADNVNDHVAHSLTAIAVAARGIRTTLDADTDPTVVTLLDAIETDARLSFRLTKLVDADMRKHQKQVAD